MSTQDKLDLFREHTAEYAAPKKPAVVETQKAKFLAVGGRGAPGGELFQERVGALYGMAYTIKFASKQAGRDYKVCPLEGLWWGARKAPRKPHAFIDGPREQWNWKLLIRTPDFVTAGDVSAARSALSAKGKGAGTEDVDLQELSEGLCVQMLHLGPYEAEHETIATMMAFAEQEGLVPDGLHHEVYLSDPRRVPPERLRTILRQPVRKR